METYALLFFHSHFSELTPNLACSSETDSSDPREPDAGAVPFSKESTPFA
jgi:hypothetical protein